MTNNEISKMKNNLTMKSVTDGVRIQTGLIQQQLENWKTELRYSCIKQQNRQGDKRH